MIQILRNVSKRYSYILNKGNLKRSILQQVLRFVKGKTLYQRFIYTTAENAGIMRDAPANMIKILLN